MDQLDLAEVHRFAARIAIEAGSYLRDQALARTQAGGASTALGDSIQIKENAADLVTKADMHSEHLISSAIRERFPGHKIIGEESYSAGQEKRFLLDDDPTWIIDPLDGTVNFVHLFPTCCVSVGFCVNKKPVVGAIFAPILGGLHLTNASGSLYSAASGLGAWSTPISFPFSPSALSTPPADAPAYAKPAPWAHAVPLPYIPPQPLPADAPKGCLFTAEWGKARSDAPESNLTKKVNSFWNMAAEVGGRGGKGGMVHGVRSLGSAALDLVYVATGAVDVFWEGGCWEWDVCAGIVLIAEAGGRVVPSQPPTAAHLSDRSLPVPDADLGSRLYLAVRPCADTADESGRQAQDRLVREIWRRTELLDYKRPT
ncbi:inositol monophosphatase family protein [Rhodotorula paludigena]|uniref:inositol monophosphatase family protein n=1 Tax=Rhodotorula paludigena TaxID=86838 RepID=UPI00317B1A86